MSSSPLTADETRTDGRVEVAITPTYSGCPAMDVIGIEVQTALARAGIPDARVRLVLSPAWTTDWMTDDGKAKLTAYGIAPPAGKASRRALFGEERVTCPHCGSAATEKVSEFGSTACKSLWRCTACRISRIPMRPAAHPSSRRASCAISAGETI